MNLACLELPPHAGGGSHRRHPERRRCHLTGRTRLGSRWSVGKQADLVIWDAPNLDYIFYCFGQNLAKTVIKRGVVATTRP